MFQDTTKQAMSINTKRQVLTILVACWPFFTVAHPLTEATVDVLAACDLVGAPSIEECGYLMGRQSDRIVARKKVVMFFKERNDFMLACEAARRDLAVCDLEAQRLIYQGFDRAELAQTRSLPRSDMRR